MDQADIVGAKVVGDLIGVRARELAGGDMSLSKNCRRAERKLKRDRWK